MGRRADEGDSHWLGMLLLLALAIFGFSLSQSGPVLAIPEIAREVGRGTGATSWVLTASLVSAGVGTPVIGRLSDLYGVRRMLFATLALVVVGSVLAAVTSDLYLLVAGRVIQGFGAGVFPTSYAVIKNEVPPRARAAAMGLVGALIGASGGVGPAIGGFVVDHASYRLIFVLVGLSAAVPLALLPLVLPGRDATSPGRADVVGIVGLATGVTVPLLGISQAGSRGWTNSWVWGSLLAGIVILMGFACYELRTPFPLLDVATLRIPAVVLTNLSAFFVGFAMYSACILVPTLARVSSSTGYGFGVGATASGALLVPGCVAMLAGAYVAGRLGRRLAGRRLLIAATLVSGVGLGLLTGYHANEFAVMTDIAIAFVGFGLAFAAMPALIVAAVPLHQLGEGTGLNALARIIGSSVGSQVVVGILIGRASLSPHLEPSAAAFDWALGVCTAAALLALLFAVALPSPARLIVASSALP